MVLALFGALVACSRSVEEREYAVPEALCGISVDRDLISKFLPSGKRIDVKEKKPVPSRNRCQVNIDGKVALVMSKEWRERGESINYVAGTHSRIDSTDSTDNGTYVYSDTGGVGRVKFCNRSARSERVLYTVVQVYATGMEDKSSMKSLIMAYTKAVERSGACQ
ncbi:hypothetical protein [Streptomyces ipomoeae]|uniref:hypothetical protein n=1 Tax=Streptomyces ipomoeae TaxID=103232 RepID=UPI0011479608|nr:hypothetical protein [Streptomyces ipomoeae]MDX2694024.1 hypothetical protein [Streptomyces ipomoeae]MDX2840419.1 hypothetical protein [Streptomyces ipomoeae]TQE31251.1 hypothetical protein Sipo7851_25855 [Streptomyces ipomoeae]